jgi:hypothetical protein
VIVTGDAFVASPAKKDALRKEFKADATEMEGAAVAQICWQRRVPCLILRSLSDSAGAKAQENVLLFEKSAAQNAALLVTSIVGRLDHFELIFNGRVIASHHLNGARTQADVSERVEIPASGWLVLRAWNDHSNPKIQDIYPYASTSPIYVTVDQKLPRSPADAAYFVSWLDRVIAGATARSDYNSPQEKQNTLQYLNAARTVFQTSTR